MHHDGRLTTCANHVIRNIQSAHRHKTMAKQSRQRPKDIGSIGGALRGIRGRRSVMEERMDRLKEETGRKRKK